MKIALIHDHLAQDGGAENILRIFAEMYPDAPIYTLLYDKEIVNKYYSNRRVEASIIQRLPGGVKHYQWYMPFMPMAVEFFDLRNFDLILSDTSSFAKGVISSPDSLHICYCHTPTRYLWSDTHQYINELKYNKYFKKIISLLLNYIRIWDRLAADRVDVFLANSKVIKRRIKKYYKRDSTVIYPPVELDKFKVSDDIDDYFLAGCRLVPYKRIDVVVQAFKENGLKLKVFGDGSDLKRLKKIAGDSKNIEFLGRVDNWTRRMLYSRCQAFINPQEEDFGITPIEAMASGRPVIAYGKAGCLETVITGTGLFFYEQTPKGINAAIKEFQSLKFDPKFIRQHAEKFSVEKFKSQIKEFIDDQWKEHSSKI